MLAITSTLTISGVFAENKTFNGNTAAILNTSNAVLSGILGADAGNVSPNGGTGVFASANAGNNIAVTATSIPIIGSAASNYNLLMPTGLFANILPASTPTPEPVAPTVIAEIPQVMFPIYVSSNYQMDQMNSSTSSTSSEVSSNYWTPTSLGGDNNSITTKANKKCVSIGASIEICS